MKSNLFKIQNIPFIEMGRAGLDNWEKMKERKFFNVSAVPTVFVNIHDLKEKARTLEPLYMSGGMFTPSIWRGCPGFMSKSWVTEHQLKKEYNYRFSTGIYGCSGTLLLMDDVIEWSHHRIESKDVRTAYDIILAIHEGKLKLD